MRTFSDVVERDLVLIGAGHSHVQVLRAFAMSGPPPGTRVTLVVDTPLAVYSGMVPGFLAGQYRADELEIDAVPLARLAGARVVLERALGVDPATRRVLVANRPPIAYDVASIDIGSTVSGLDLPGVSAHAVASRPIGRFIRHMAALDADAAAAAAAKRRFAVVVVGGGAGGVEVAATLAARLVPIATVGVDVTLVFGGSRLLADRGARLARRVAKELSARGVVLRPVVAVKAVIAGQVTIEPSGGGGPQQLTADVVMWVTGAASHDFGRVSRLPVDDRGFIAVRPTLQVVGHDQLFASGDCASLVDHPGTPKAGVYAVRQGPYLTHNLRAACAASSTGSSFSAAQLREYRPQRDFLTLLNLGDGTAVGEKWGIPFAGRWVMALKDSIDRKFMTRFQVLAADGGPGPALATMRPMDGGAAQVSSSETGEPAPGAMVCGGCAAKLGQAALDRALSRVTSETTAPPAAPEVILGLAEADDVVAVQLPGRPEVLVASVDAFRAPTDDPYLVGRVAALNAVSDLEAKGVAARWAQALVTLPLAELDAKAEETLFQVLAGARSALDLLGVSLLGGHTSRGPELQVGFAVQGLASSADALLRRRGALAAGQVLVLTRPLGTGVLLHADMMGRARGPWVESLLAALAGAGSRPLGNATAAAILGRHGASAVTDVTGFGLAGHLLSMLAGSSFAAQLTLRNLPALPGALELLARGEQSTFHQANVTASAAVLDVDATLAETARFALLFDPQTAGGLLAALPAAAAVAALAELAGAGETVAVEIGQLAAIGADGRRLIVEA